MRRLVCLLLLAVFALSPTTGVYALSEGQKETIDAGAGYFNVARGNDCSSSSSTPNASGLAAGSKLFFIGDSLMVGNIGSGSLLTKAVEAGYVVDTNPTKTGNRYKGKSAEAEVSIRIAATITHLKEHPEDLAADKVDVFVVALGTNQESDMVSSMTALVSYLRSVNANPDLKIIWVNTNYTAKLSRTNAQVNADIQIAAQQLNLGVIDLAGNTSLALNSDGIHTNADGNIKRSDAIIAGLKSYTGGGGLATLSASGSVGAGLAGCSCSPGSPPAALMTAEDRYRFTWGYLIGKGLSENAAAGLMGNLEAESGINPHNMQNNASLPDGPEFPTEINAAGLKVPHSAIKGAKGYGIAQWTSAGRQQALIDYAAETNRSTGDLALQLDFLWKELSSSYAGVLAKLMQPDVTVDDAAREVVRRYEVPKSIVEEKTDPEGAQRTINARAAQSRAILARFTGTSGSGPSGISCGSALGTAIDIARQDTSDVACASGSSEIGIFDAYDNGKTNIKKVKTCQVGNLKVNSQLSGSIVALLNAAKADGINLDQGSPSSFRSLAQQEAVYVKWCNSAGINPTAGPYPKDKVDQYTRCPGGAPPGFSNHEMGFAIDFTCDGGSIGQSYTTASANKCFQWLLANAGKYNLLEWGKGQARDNADYEGWHWSVDGT